MPSAVSDAGPLIHLAQINKLHLLKMLYNQAVITPRVKREAYDMGAKHGHADATIGKAIEDGWIKVEKLQKQLISSSKKLASKEKISQADAETLLLAKEKKAEILVDEKALSNIARLHGLRVWSTSILLEALSRGYIEVSDIEAAIRQLDEKRHKLKREHVEQILEVAKTIACRRK
ncbi:conserved hypothetical protein [Candidatus Caldarchaeum subterraneum]|uniref:DUF3368 domain-containing protein n=1 Tax=Caldiarchaeum subterraneum TaxID=311458 RepID=E6N6D5_CALS0|nr:conserved hypothetical protein [Candidatus Caldarchaeum subterraneum]BAJ49500.1 conserved hypothetical protein [Candidatus Caldarchaeum subterraneum]BAJ50718.1 conserved hypothetical protein [Candidatus Caldarchaeum subterraneum]